MFSHQHALLNLLVWAKVDHICSEEGIILTLQCVVMVNIIMFRTLISLFSQIKHWYIRARIHIMLVRIANREDSDQTASSEAV